MYYLCCLSLSKLICVKKEIKASMLIDPKIERTTGRLNKNKRQKQLLKQQLQQQTRTIIPHLIWALTAKFKWLQGTTNKGCWETTHYFANLDREDPFNHITLFCNLCGTLDTDTNDEDIVYLRRFPFSFTGKTKIWLQSHPNQSITS